VDRDLARASRQHQLLGLLYIDLDGFKLVNDSLGHHTGDLLLSQVADRFRARVRASDTLARLGGDEFTVILTSLRSEDDAMRAANSLIECLSHPFLVEGHQITILARDPDKVPGLHTLPGVQLVAGTLTSAAVITENCIVQATK